MLIFVYVICFDRFLIGNLCQFNIDECASDPCNQGDCIDLASGYECVCDTQWSGENCDVYLDPCGFTPCQNGAQCGPTGDYLSFTCTCPQGYTGKNFLWNYLYLYSSYHLEHHYFPSVPFYNLKKLQVELVPFFEEKNIRAYGYSELFKIWIYDNHAPHSSVVVK